ncbi:MAG: hypothetical protein ACHP9Y_01080 [Gammaproteobacteria bacterium]
MATTMRRWAETLLSKPLYAALFAGFCMFVPLLSWVGWGWVALAALRYDPRYSILVLLGAIVGIFAITNVIGEVWQVAAFHAILFIIPIWVFSLVLRTTVSLNFTLQCIAISLLVLMLIADFFQLMTPASISEFLQSRFNHVVTFDAETLQSMNAFAEQFAVSWPSAFFWVYLSGLFLGRWWQAALDNPGGFQREFHALRLNFWVGSISVIFLLISFWLPLNSMTMAASGLIMSLLLVAGLGVVHYWVAFKKYSTWVLIGVYAGLFLLTIIFLPILIVIAATDSMTDLRKKIA